MRRFSNGQRVTVSNKDHPLFSKSGIVVRLLFRDHSAWVKMDDPITDELALFPKGHNRRDHVNIFPEDCQ